MTASKLVLNAASGASGGDTTDVDDVFSTFLWEGNSHPQVIENGIALGNANDGGSVSFGTTASRLDIASSTDFNFGTGDFTLDYSVWWGDGSQFQNIFSRGYTSSGGIVHQLSTDGTSNVYVSGGGFISDSTARAEGNWYQYCITRESGTVKLYVNGTLAATATGNDDITSSHALNIGDDDATTGYGINGGEQGFISNFRIIKGSAVAPPSGGYTSDLTAVSGTVLLTCQGDTPFVDNSSSSHSITKVNTVTASGFGPFTGSSGEGGLVWGKARTQSYKHTLFDTARGVNKAMSSNSNAAEATETGVTAFNSSGFILGTWAGLNENGEDFVSWTFRKAPKFFDVVTYSSNQSSSQTINHNLGSVPGMIMVKRTSASANWAVYHRGADSSNPEQYALNLNTTGVRNQGTSFWNDTAPTSTQFTVGNNALTNDSDAADYVAYLFAHNNNDGEFGPDSDQDIIKCGSFSHTSGTPTFVDCGFEAAWVMVKRKDGVDSWWMADSMRGFTVNGINSEWAAADLLSTGNSDWIGPNAQGFDFNYQTGNWIYMAIRRGSLNVPEDATNVFHTQSQSSGSIYFVGFPTDLLIHSKLSNSSINGITATRLIGDNQYLITNSDQAEGTSSGVWKFDLQNSFQQGATTGQASIGWHWKRAKGYFDVVAYTGTGSNTTVTHNLGVIPEMMWVKPRNITDHWHVYHKDSTANNYLLLNENLANVDSDTVWNDTTPTSSVFTVGTNGGVNGNGNKYVAYLFATVAGVSKVGSYTGTGSDGNQIDCGFSSGARFVLIKRTDSTGDWTVFDSVRGIVAGDDPYLRLNLTSAEQTGYDVIDPYSSGFTINNQASLNLSGASYIFYAIA